MPAGTIYMVDGDNLHEMTPSAPASEDQMQVLVARYPQLITDGDGELLLISRETAISDGAIQSRWSLDHLFVTREAVPVFVELKRATDTRIRREVVGQLIDYAANGSAHWGAGSIADTFARSNPGEAGDMLLAQFLGDRDPDEFWEQVDSNLRSGRIKMVFVADVIPKELAIVIEFLNGQMRADVRAIELRWFAGDGDVTTLVPRVIGESVQAAVAKKSGWQPRVSVDEWLEDRILPLGMEAMEGARIACEIAERAGAELFVPTTRGSIVGAWRTDDGKWAYPFGIYPSARIVLRLGYLKHRPAFTSDIDRQKLYDRLTGIVGSLHTNSIAGEPGFSAELLSDPDLASRYEEFLQDVASQAVAA